MRLILGLCLVAALATAAPSNDYTTAWSLFKREYKRQYASSVEDARRFNIFVHNMKRAEKLSVANPLARFGVNEFSDKAPHEFKTRHNSEKFYKAQANSKLEVKSMSEAEKNLAAGKSIDWRSKGAVTPVKNQGDCGSCWSFSTTGGIEGQWFLAGHLLTSVSEQELVSCDTIDAGCNGGLMDNAFQWLLASNNGSIVTEASYPYVSGTGSVPACSLNGKKFGARIDAFKNIAKSESDMAAFVYSSGPLSIAVDATSWQTYTGGIMTNCASTQVDHGVLIVGFDDNNNPPYWVIKNSWGKTWGEHGYIRVQKGTDQCLITTNPCTSEVKRAGPSPTPPSPPSPPSPAGATFEQRTCIDNTCKDCTSMTFDQNKCIAGQSHSFIGQCITGGLLVTTYSNRNCTGTGIATVNPTQVCSAIFRKDDERFVDNICNAGPKPKPPTPAPSPTPPPAPTPVPTFPSGWVNLFAPPYAGCPTIMMAISAVDNATQYVPGGENGSGFTTFEFNGEFNGQFTPLTMPDMAMMIMAIAVGGTSDAPKGFVGGFGIGNGVQYFVNATTLLPSFIPTLLVVTQDARITRDGKFGLVVDNAQNAALFTADAGKTFSEFLLNTTNNCTEARYGAIIDANTWYVSLGNWPANNRRHKTSKFHHHLSETLTMERCPKTGKIRRARHAPLSQVGSGSGSSECNGYSAMIVKTADGGKTFQTQVNLNTNFYFNGIDCFDAKHCIAVGEGFNEGAGGHIYLTEDGTNWKQVFFAESNANGQFSFMSVRFSGSSGKEAWVGGSFMISQVSSEGIFYHTHDGGKTWKKYPHGLPNIGDVTSISMLPDGTGFATALTIFDDSTILRYDPTGPPPPGYFIQEQCPSAGCAFLCQNVSFPQDMCLQMSNGGSGLSQCVPGAVQTTVYQSSDCTGPSNVTTSPLNTCLNGGSNFFENFCPPNGGAGSIQPPIGKRLLREL